MTVLHVMSLIIERMQAEIQPHVSCLVHYLPSLWDSSTDHGMLCCAIISALTTVVQVSNLSRCTVCPGELCDHVAFIVRCVTRFSILQLTD